MEKKTDKRQLLIDTAIRLFNRHGIGGTATAQISAEAGVATGTLYTYFKSKDELVDSCYLYCAQAYYDYCNQRLEQFSSPLEKLTERAINSMYWGVEHPEEIKFQLSEHFSRFSVIGEHVDVFTQDIADLMAQAKDAGEVKDLPCELLVEMELGVMTFALGYVYNHRDICCEEGFIRKMVISAMDCVRKI